MALQFPPNLHRAPRFAGLYIHHAHFPANVTAHFRFVGFCRWR